MRFLITGVSGVVGRNLYELIRQNKAFEVYGTGRSKLSLENYIQMDLTDEISLSEVFATHQFDTIIHCAAMISNEPTFEVYRNNVSSTLNIVQASLNTNVKKIFYISSISIIGKILQSPITELHKVAPLSTYAFSKYKCEELIEHFCDKKIKFLNVRIPSPVGKYMPLRSVFPIFLDRITNNLDVTLTGDAGRKMSFLDLRDLGDFISLASENVEASGLFNVGAKTSHSNHELAQTMISKTESKSKVIDLTDSDSVSISDWSLCCAKIKSVFDYEPRYSLEETIEWILGEKI
jgi:UDP-glucose 4-epimerase